MFIFQNSDIWFFFLVDEIINVYVKREKNNKLEAKSYSFNFVLGQQAQGLKPSIFGGASGGQQQQKTASLFGSSTTSSVFGAASNTTGQQGK